MFFLLVRLTCPADIWTGSKASGGVIILVRRSRQPETGLQVVQCAQVISHIYQRNTAVIVPLIPVKQPRGKAVLACPWF